MSKEIKNTDNEMIEDGVIVEDEAVESAEDEATVESTDGDTNTETKDEAFDEVKKPKSPKAVKFKKFGVHFALALGILTIGLMGYTAGKLMSQEKDIEKQVELAQKQKEESEIPDDVKEQASQTVGNTKEESAFDAVEGVEDPTKQEIKNNAELNITWSDPLTEGTIKYIGDNDAYSAVLPEGSTFVLTEYKVMNKVFDYTYAPTVIFTINASGDSYAATTAFKAHYEDGTTSEWVENLWDIKIEKGMVIQQLSYTDNLGDNYDIFWCAPDDKTYCDFIVGSGSGYNPEAETVETSTEVESDDEETSETTTEDSEE